MDYTVSDQRKRIHPYKFNLWVALGAIVMMFGGFTSAYLVMHTRDTWVSFELPEQFWEWMAITPEECWSLTPREYLGLKSRLFVVANVPHPPNCLRHGFCTYDIAANKNPGRTATRLCHTDQEELWEHYNGEATSEAGKKYQRITPTTAAEIAKGFVPAVTALPATPAGARQPLQA